MEMAHLHIRDLPGEILVSILNHIDTQHLFDISTISRQFHALISRVIHLRMLLAAELPGYRIILEAYHPSHRYSDPYLFCTYLSTPGLCSNQIGEGSPHESGACPTGRLAKLGELYSHFRPERPGIRGSLPAQRIAGATPAAGNEMQPVYANGGDGGETKVVHKMSLDEDELFGQFCAYASLVRLGPRRGVFMHMTPLVPPGQGVMRVWRCWLLEQAKRSLSDEQRRRDAKDIGAGSNADPAASSRGSGISSIASQNSLSEEERQGIIWTECRRNVGLQIQIRQELTEDVHQASTTSHSPIPSPSTSPSSFSTSSSSSNHSDQRSSFPSSYSSNISSTSRDQIPSQTFTIEIKEFIVRTAYLTLAMETCRREQETRSGQKAVIFGNFRMGNDR